MALRQGIKRYIEIVLKSKLFALQSVLLRLIYGQTQIALSLLIISNESE